MISTKRQAIREKIAQLEAEEKELLTKERPEALKKVRELIAEYGFTGTELKISPSESKEPKFGSKKPGKQKVDPKYANPQDPSMTWSGRGIAPKWFNGELAQGKTKEDMLISKAR